MKRLFSRPGTVRAFAVFAIAGLVLSAAAVALTGGLASEAPKPASTTVDSTPDPAMSEQSLRAETLTRLDALTALGDAQAAVRQAMAASTEALAKASKPVNIPGGVNGILAVGSLPELPLEYIPGAGFDALVKAPRAVPYTLPTFTGGLSLDSLPQLDVMDLASPVTERNGLHLPPTGVPQVDALAGQLSGAWSTLEGALATLDGTLGGPDLSSLSLPPGIVDDPGLAGESPELEISSAPARDANDVADPDEKGADVARAHAQALLGSAESAFAATQPRLAALAAAYQGLAAQVQGLVAAAHAEASKAGTAIDAELTDRLESLQTQASEAQKEAARMVNAYRVAVEAAAAKAEAALQAAIEAQVADVQSSVTSDLENLQALAKQVKALAEARKAEIANVVESASMELAQLQEKAGLDTTASIETLRATGTAALVKLQEDATAQIQTLTESATALQAKGEAAVRALAKSGLGGLALINGTTQQALEHADEVKEYLVGMAKAQVDVAAASEEMAATLALGQLAKLEKVRVAQLIQTGIALTNSAPSVGSVMESLLEKVEGGTSVQVLHDIKYILDVSEDYSTVPVGPRMERADFWSTVADASETRLDKVLDTTKDLDGLVTTLLSAASSARTQIEALA